MFVLCTFMPVKCVKESKRLHFGDFSNIVVCAVYFVYVAQYKPMIV